MNTFTQIIYHIIFGPKNHQKTITANYRQELYKYFRGILKNKKCHLYRMGGSSDHIQIVTHLHPLISLASVVKDIKIASSVFVREKNLFPIFTGWQDGYAGFACSFKDKDRLIEYVKNQEEHHKTITFREELIELLIEQGIEFDEKYLL